jgi:hypothetical protein
MITDADIEKMKKVFATKDDLKLLTNKFETKFSTKEELKREASVLNEKIDVSIREVLDFISETKNDIMKELNDFRSEFNEFRVEMRDINRNNQSTLNNHETRITHLEYVSKSS